MAAGRKKTKAKWDSDVEWKIIDIWADILEEFDGKMITRKIKETIVTTRLNTYISEKLKRTEQYSEKAVCNKIDWKIKKGKQMYVCYPKKGETGKECTQEEAEMDLEVAELAWPNFKTFYSCFKDHPALGPGSVDDSIVTPGPSVAREEVVASVVEQENDGNEEYTSRTSRCPSRTSNRSTGAGGSNEDDDDDVDNEIANPPQRAKEGETSLVARVGKRKGKQTGASQFLTVFSDLLEQAQMRQMDHERKMQQEALAFQQ